MPGEDDLALFRRNLVRLLRDQLERVPAFTIEDLLGDDAAMEALADAILSEPLASEVRPTLTVVSDVEPRPLILPGDDQDPGGARMVLPDLGQHRVVAPEDDFLRDVDPKEKERRRVAYEEAKLAVADRPPLTSPPGTDSVEEAIAEEICALAHHRGNTYFGGHCDECMNLARFAVRTVLGSLRYREVKAEHQEAIALARRMVVTGQDWRNEDPRTLALALVAIDDAMRS